MSFNLSILKLAQYMLQYHAVPGTDIKVPVMTLGDDLMKLSLNGSTSNVAIAKGKIPTLGDVKRSLRVSTVF